MWFSLENFLHVLCARTCAIMSFMPKPISKWIYRIYLRVGADKSTTGKLYHLWIRPLRRCRTKHMPFSSSPLWLNMLRLFVILSLTQLYRYTPEIFLFSTATFKYTYRSPSDELEKNIQRTLHFLLLSHWNGYNHFRFALDFSYAFGIL